MRMVARYDIHPPLWPRSPWEEAEAKGWLAAFSDVAQIAAPSKKRRRCHGPTGDADGSIQPRTAPLPEYDAHFHPDRIRSMGGNGTDPGRRPDYSVDLVGGVLSYCDPEFFLDSDFVDRVIATQGGSTKWKIAISIHPKKAATYTRQQWQALLQHLNHPSVVGFSEVGFDFTVPPQQWRDQENLFWDFLDLGTRGRVLILHLRGSGGNVGVHAIRRRLLRQKCPEDQRIHPHCTTWRTRKEGRRSGLPFMPLVRRESCRAPMACPCRWRQPIHTAGCVEVMVLPERRLDFTNKQVLRPGRTWTCQTVDITASGEWLEVLTDTVDTCWHMLTSYGNIKTNTHLVSATHTFGKYAGAAMSVKKRGLILFI